MPKGKTGGLVGRPKSLNNQNNQDTSEDIGNPPESLSIIGKGLWEHIRGTAKWLKESDYYSVLELCRAYERRELINMEIDLGIVSMTQEIERQGLRATPQVAILQQLSVSITTMFRELGLSPLGRQGINQADEEQEDRISDFFSRKRPPKETEE